MLKGKRLSSKTPSLYQHHLGGLLSQTPNSNRFPQVLSLPALLHCWFQSFPPRLRCKIKQSCSKVVHLQYETSGDLGAMQLMIQRAVWVQDSPFLTSLWLQPMLVPRQYSVEGFGKFRNFVSHRSVLLFQALNAELHSHTHFLPF